MPYLSHLQRHKMSNQQNPQQTKVVQKQVDEVVGIMQDNIQKVMQRGEQLDTLQDRTENLQQSSQQFRKGANRVRKQMWWKNMKMNLIIGGVLLLVILIIIGMFNLLCFWLLVSVTTSNKASGNTPAPAPAPSS